MECPIVKTTNGLVSGSVTYIQHKEAKKVYRYRNIPYAKPPLGKLRFLKPQPVESWSGIRDGNVVGKICMQNSQSTKAEEPYFPHKSTPGELDDMNEDSLHLTVYTTTTEMKNMPVMFWIYGGSFQDGSERLYDGSAMAGLNDVVVVMPNYRLNVFGFLSLGKGSCCPGNAGLWDQNMALQWVQTNISAFGGDSKNVTIFGESAGGMSVHHHILSTKSRHLFHRAISHSGQANATDFFVQDNEENTKLLLKCLEIEDQDEKDILTKLQAVPARKLLEANIQMIENSGWLNKFLPCIDGEFLTKSPIKLLADGLPSIPYMIGCNNSETSGAFGALLCGDDYFTGISADQFKTSAMFPVTSENLQEWSKFYNIDHSDKLALSKLYCKVSGDKVFVQPAVTAARRHAEFGNVYFYHACFQLKLFHDEQYGPLSGMKPSWCYCDHSDDIYMMLGVPFNPGELRLGGRFSSDENELSIKCMKYLTNFGKTGDPNKGAEVEIHWPKFNEDKNHLIIDHKIWVGNCLAERETKYWEEFNG